MIIFLVLLNYFSKLNLKKYIFIIYSRNNYLKKILYLKNFNSFKNNQIIKIQFKNYSLKVKFSFKL